MTTPLILLQIAEDPILTGLEAMQKISLKLFWRLLIDFASVFVLVRLVYYRVYRRSDLFFTFFIFNLVIFFICFLLNKVDLSMGAAFGLFAVFSMLRYRTEDISIKDMSYLFLLIAIGLINAVTKIKDASDVYESAFLIFVNAFIIVITFLLESKVFFKKEQVQVVTYDNIDLINKNNQQLLIDDLKNRTGLNITRVQVGKIDLLKDSAQIRIYYIED